MASAGRGKRSTATQVSGVVRGTVAQVCARLYATMAILLIFYIIQYRN